MGRPKKLVAPTSISAAVDVAALVKEIEAIITEAKPLLTLYEAATGTPYAMNGNRYALPSPKGSKLATALDGMRKRVANSSEPTKAKGEKALEFLKGHKADGKHAWASVTEIGKAINCGVVSRALELIPDAPVDRKGKGRGTEYRYKAE